MVTSQIQRLLGSQGATIEQGFLKGLFSQCDSILKQMTVEARNSTDVEMEELLSRVNLYRIQLHSLKQHVGETRTETKRDELGLSKIPQRTSSRTSHPEESLSTRAKLNQQNSTLERARRAMADTEETAGTIAEELHRNRSTIEKSQGKVAEVSGLTNDANQILSRMKKRWF